MDYCFNLLIISLYLWILMKYSKKNAFKILTGKSEAIIVKLFLNLSINCALLVTNTNRKLIQLICS